jgi:hypothetical protein
LAMTKTLRSESIRPLISRARLAMMSLLYWIVSSRAKFAVSVGL